MNPSPDLAALIELVAADVELQCALACEKSPEGFAEACVTLAENRRLRITADEVRALLQARTIAWHQRNLR